MTRQKPLMQLVLLLRQGFSAELADKERLLSPVLFGVTMLVLFAFALGDVDPSLRIKVFVAQTFLTSFFALQVSFSRLFEPDRQDRVFDLIRTYPVSYTAWFLAKYLLLLLLGVLTLFPMLAISSFLSLGARDGVVLWPIFAIALTSLAGLAAIGILLSAMTLKAAARQILYPLLYFPLTAPVLLAAVNASLVYLENQKFTEVVQNWCYLLLLFDVIYFTLGLLLFAELVDDT